MAKGTDRAAPRRSAAVVAILIAGALAIVVWGYRAMREDAFSLGAAHGARTLNRLQLIWPDYLQMSQEDRLVLANLSQRCKLHEEPAIPQRVVQCLARAAQDDAVDQATLARVLPSQYVPALQ
jgi:hypothetical protein